MAVCLTDQVCQRIPQAGAASEDDEVVPDLGNGGNPFPDGLGDDCGNSGVGMDPYLVQLVYLDQPSVITGKVAQIQVA